MGKQRLYDNELLNVERGTSNFQRVACALNI